VGTHSTLDGSGRRGEPHDPLATDLAARLRFEALVIDLAAGFVHVEAERVDQAIEDCLRHVVEALELDRSTLFQRSGDDMIVTHSWAAPGYEKFPTVWAKADLPWALALILGGGTLVFSRPEDLPPEAAVDRVAVERFGPRANVTMPLLVGDRVIGGLAFGSMERERSWSAPLLERLRSVAHMVAGVLARRDMDRQLRAALASNEDLRLRLERENGYLREQARSLAGAPRLVGQGPGMQRVLSLVERVGPTDAPVLITGETGVGKELVAEEIHARSPRADRTLVKVNCAALAPTLIEAELFGREKGAYTGALTRQIGRFELAHGSTLFLDEIGELPLALQAKLLRVLQDGTFERLGSPRTLRADVRIIAATNRDLERAIAEERFRSDLYFRLAVVPVEIPPLRERSEDIPLLVRSIVDEVARKMGRRIDAVSEASLAQLRRYRWPGNIRELRNVVERAIILGHQGTLQIDLPEQRSAVAPPSPTLAEMERHHIMHVLDQTGWRVRGADGAAQVLGLPPSTLETRMAKLGIRRPA
jgi:formate hydrogenlyase transcriptional activator